MKNSMGFRISKKELVNCKNHRFIFVKISKKIIFCNFLFLILSLKSMKNRNFNVLNKWS